MVLYTVYSHSIQQRYKTHVCSKATLFLFCTLVLTYIPPLFIAYYTQGFWIRESKYREQPEVHFKHDFIVMVQGSALNSFLAYSTYQNFNNLLNSHKRIPFVQSFEEDTNGDGKNDFLDFELDFPLQDTESANYVQLLLFFDYRLHKFSSVRMECMAYVQYSSVVAGSEFSVVGDLKLRQRFLLPSKGSYTTFNTPIVDSTSIHAENYDLTTIFQRYFTRNVSTEFLTKFPVWKGSRAQGSPFKLKVRIYYPEETISYRPGFFQIIKFAWVQYLAILVIFLYVFNRFKIGVFQNQVFTTIPQKVMAKWHND